MLTTQRKLRVGQSSKLPQLHLSSYAVPGSLCGKHEMKHLNFNKKKMFFSLCLTDVRWKKWLIKAHPACHCSTSHKHSPADVSPSTNVTVKELDISPNFKQVVAATIAPAQPAAWWSGKTPGIWKPWIKSFFQTNKTHSLKGTGDQQLWGRRERSPIECRPLCVFS